MEWGTCARESQARHGAFHGLVARRHRLHGRAGDRDPRHRVHVDPWLDYIAVYTLYWVRKQTATL